MSTDTATELDITGLYFPRGNDSRHVDWSELNRDAEYDEGYSYAESFDYARDHGGEVFTAEATVTIDPSTVREA